MESRETPEDAKLTTSSRSSYLAAYKKVNVVFFFFFFEMNKILNEVCVFVSTSSKASTWSGVVSDDGWSTTGFAAVPIFFCKSRARSLRLSHYTVYIHAPKTERTNNGSVRAGSGLPDSIRKNPAHGQCPLCLCL